MVAIFHRPTKRYKHVNTQFAGARAHTLIISFQKCCVIMLSEFGETNKSCMVKKKTWLKTQTDTQ